MHSNRGSPLGRPSPSPSHGNNGSPLGQPSPSQGSNDSTLGRPSLTRGNDDFSLGWPAPTPRNGDSLVGSPSPSRGDDEFASGWPMPAPRNGSSLVGSPSPSRGTKGFSFGRPSPSARIGGSLVGSPAPSRGSSWSRGSPGVRGAYGGRQLFNGNNRDGRGIPNRTIMVPSEFQRQTKDVERERLTASWKSETGCEVIPLCELMADRIVITKFEVFGAASKLDEVTQKIEAWIRYSITKSKDSTGWAKLPAHTTEAWVQTRMQIDEDDRKKKFLRAMLEDEEVVYIHEVIVHWPEELKEAGVSMKDVLGTGLVKLDPIRTNDEVFIKAVGMDRLEIRASDLNSAQSAEQHVKVLLRKAQVTIDSKVVYPKYVILDGGEDSRNNVIYERADAWWPDHGRHLISPRWSSLRTSAQLTKDWKDLEPSQYSDIQDELQRALDIAKYQNGTYDLSIRLGCLAIKKDVTAIGKTDNETTFMADITNRKELACAIKPWVLDDKAGEQLVERLFSADHLLEPAAPRLGFGFANKPATLSGTKNFPTICGTWVFMDPNASDVKSPHYVVQMHWTIDEDGLFEKEHMKFYRLSLGSKTPDENLDIKLLELNKSKGWQFNLTSMKLIKSTLVPAAIRHFADSTTIKAKNDIASKATFIDFNIGLSLKLIAGRLDKIYTVGIKNTGYKVDMMIMWYPGRSTPCWGLSLYHGDWQSHLAKAEQLRAGECVEWGDTMKTFLPDNGFCAPPVAARDQPKEVDHEGNTLPGAGIKLLLNKMMELSKVALPCEPSDSVD